MLSLFKKKRHVTADGRITNYSSTTEFVNQNLTDVKALISFVGYYDLNKRLEDLTHMTHCHVIALCQKLQETDKFLVIESSDRTLCQRGTAFTWTHTQPMALGNASNILSSLPFDIVGAQGFVTAPIKNERNMLTGVLIGITMENIDDPDSKTRLMHLLAPYFEPEIRCWKLRQDTRQLEQRIASLNQNIEIMTEDIRKEQETSIESKELKSIFLTNLSHEIRTPLNSIMGFVDLMQKEDNIDEVRKFATLVKQNSARLLSTIDNLVEISKLQSNYMLKPACPVQLNEIITKMKTKYEEVLKKDHKDVIIETSFALDTPNDTIWNSDEIITKVLELLLDNACRFTQTGKITISYTVNHKETIFSVSDTGSGIKEGMEEKIFNAFDTDTEQLTSDMGNQGKGVGLALARKYLSLANGRIWVDTSYHEGASFMFSIPTEKL